MGDVVFHPLTKEPLEEEQLVPAIRETEEYLGREMWDKTRDIREALRDLRAKVAPTLPGVRYRTERQAKIARCPRCGESL